RDEEGGELAGLLGAQLPILQRDLSGPDVDTEQRLLDLSGPGDPVTAGLAALVLAHCLLLSVVLLGVLLVASAWLEHGECVFWPLCEAPNVLVGVRVFRDTESEPRAGV